MTDYIYREWIIMTVTGCLMYFLCPYVFAFLTPVDEVQRMGVSVLRIELWLSLYLRRSIV